MSHLQASLLLGIKMVIPTSAGPRRSRPSACRRVSRLQPCGPSGLDKPVEACPVHMDVLRPPWLCPRDASSSASIPSC